MIHLAKLITKLFVLAYFGITSTWAAPDSETESCDNWSATMSLHGLDPDIFSRIMWRESRCEAWQVNEADPNGGSFGLLQINAIHLRDVEVRPQLWTGIGNCQVETTGDLLVGWKNICFASVLYAHAGGEPWGIQ